MSASSLSGRQKLTSLVIDSSEPLPDVRRHSLSVVEVQHRSVATLFVTDLTHLLDPCHQLSHLRGRDFIELALSPRPDTHGGSAGCPQNNFFGSPMDNLIALLKMSCTHGPAYRLVESSLQLTPNPLATGRAHEEPTESIRFYRSFRADDPS